MMNRRNDIDCLKAIGIVLMIMGHIEFGNYFDKFIHAFHIPLFLLVSGYLHKPLSRKLSVIVTEKVKSLIVPYLLWGILFLCMAFLQYILHLKTYDEFISNISHFFLVNTNGMAIAGAIWYLTAIFVIEILYGILDLVAMNVKVKGIIAFCCFVIGFSCGINDIRLPWACDVALVGMLFYYIGCEFKKAFDKFILFNGTTVGMAFLIAVLCICFNTSVNMRMASYGNPILFVVGAVAMTLVLLWCSNKLLDKDIWFMKEMLYIGRNSLVYLCANEFVLFFLKTILRFSADTVVIDLFLRILILIVGLIILHFTTLILKNTPLKIFVGNK